MSDEKMHWVTKTTSAIAWRALRAYAWIIGYRFKRHLPSSPRGKGLSLPDSYKDLELTEIKEKAKASLTASGVFFAFSTAVLVALVSTENIRKELSLALHGDFLTKFIISIVSVVLSLMVIRQERYISAASSDKDNKEEEFKLRRQRHCVLAIIFLLVVLFFIIAPLASPFGFINKRSFIDAFAISGFLLIILSSFFLLFALEFYDSASGWRMRKTKKIQPGHASPDNSMNADKVQVTKPVLHFHLASIASHSTLIGVCLALTGISQLLCLIDFWLGRLVTCVTLFILVAMTEIERALWDAQP